MSEVDRAKARFHAAGLAAVKAVGEDLLGESQRRAPVEEGTLRASGDLDVDDKGGVITATVTFNTVYAAAQHEGMDFDHPKGGQSKYLESVLKERAGRYEGILAAAYRRAL